MSVEAIALVLNHSKAKGTAKLVLIGIANHEGDGGSWPSIGTLARYANVDARSVQRAIEVLTDMGELAVEVKGGGTVGTRADRRTNRYRILVTPSTREVTPASGREHDEVTSASGRSEVTQMSPRGIHEVTPVTERGDAGDAHEVTPTSPEPSLEPSPKPKPNTFAAQAPPTTDAIKPKPERGSRIPENFVPTERDWKLMAPKCPDVDPHEETAQFIDWWQAATGRNSTKRDWDAAWRVWMRDAQKRAIRYGGPNRVPTTTARVKAGLSLVEELRAEEIQATAHLMIGGTA
jgi:hypothetical protein